MNSRLTNLLPADAERALRREYFLRLATLSAFGLASIGIAFGALLLPAYIYVQEEVAARENHLADLSERLASSEAQELSTRLSMLESDAALLSALAEKPTASAALRRVLEVSHAAIQVTGLTFTAPVDGAGKMSVAGIANSREALRNYVRALDALPFVDKAELPLSAYAKETDISFTIQLSGTLTP